jgi:hypothetical protein
VDASSASAVDAPGIPLVLVPEYSSSAEQMRRQLGPFTTLAKRMSNGLETMLVTPHGLAHEDRPEVQDGTP